MIDGQWFSGWLLTMKRGWVFASQLVLATGTELRTSIEILKTNIRKKMLRVNKMATTSTPSSGVAGVTPAEFQPVRTPKSRRGQRSPATTARRPESFKERRQEGKQLKRRLRSSRMVGDWRPSTSKGQTAETMFVSPKTANRIEQKCVDGEMKIGYWNVEGLAKLRMATWQMKRHGLCVGDPQRQLVLYSHILRLENSDPLQMATFDVNLNQPSPPVSSKKRGRPRSFWVKEVGAIVRDRVLHLPRGIRQRRSVQEVAQDCNLWRKICMIN